MNSEVVLDDDTPQRPQAPDKLQRAPLAVVKRYDGLFDDVLGLGRVDADSQTLVRRLDTKNAQHLCITVSGAHGDHDRFITSPINPSGTSFDPFLYLARVHKGSSQDELISGMGMLAKLKERLKEDAENFRAEKYASAAVAEAALERTKEQLKHISPFANGRGGSETQVFERAEAMLKSRYEAVMAREKKLESLRRTLVVFTRYHWVFSLGERLRTCCFEGVKVIEQVVVDYIRAVKWLEAQGNADVTQIRGDIRNGFGIMLDALLVRLSKDHASSQEMSRLVHVLISLNKEEFFYNALQKRMSHAVDLLDKATRPPDPVLLPDIRSPGNRAEDIMDAVSRSSEAFCDGLEHVWRLGRVLVGEKCGRAVHSNLLSLCHSFSETLRVKVLENKDLISKQIVQKVTVVRKKALMDIAIPPACLAPFESVRHEIIDSFLAELCRSMDRNASRIASQFAQSDKTYSLAAEQFCSNVIETLCLVDTSVAKKTTKKSETEWGSSDIAFEKSEAANNVLASDEDHPMLVRLARVVTQLPMDFAGDVHEKIMLKDLSEEERTLKLAVFLSTLHGKGVQEISSKMASCSVFRNCDWKEGMEATEITLSEMLKEETTKYVGLVSKPLKILAKGLVTFPEEDLEDTMSRAIQIKIEGISKSANEIALQLALVIIGVRNKTKNEKLIRNVLVSLIKEIGGTLVEVLSTDKLIYHRAAQLWVDVTFMQDMITKGADSDSKGLQEALDGFSRVKERSVQAVLADGYSFSVADMKVLRESVVGTGIALADIVQECYRETWRIVATWDTDTE